MRLRELSFTAGDQQEIYFYNWLPEGEVKAVVSIAHGMAERALRYERFAGDLTSAGFAVYVADLRGHGRTAGNPDNVGIVATDALTLMTDDLRRLSGLIRKEFPAVPLFLFGHSMGSFLAQGYMIQGGEELQGVVLSGVLGPAGLLTLAGKLIAGGESALAGRNSRSKLLNVLSFGSYNNQFQPARTAFDWLSRDSAEVDKYINDPYCGGVFPAGFFYDLFSYWRMIHRPDGLRKISLNLPLYFISGSNDPVAGNTRGVKKLIKIYEQLGMKDITYKFYEGGRHEMLNEINRAEVIADLISWLDNKIQN